MKVILHIGVEKTGTTSIQRALWQSRTELADRGILVPKLLGYANHTEVVVAARDPSKQDELSTQILKNRTHDELSHDISRALQRELKRASFDRLIISTEHCHSRIRTADELKRLVNILGVSTSDVQVVVYLRRQDQLWVSANSTGIKSGNGGSEMLTMPAQDSPYFDYLRLLSLYKSVFGEGQVIVRLFEPALLHEADIVADFFHCLDLGAPPPNSPSLNKKLSAKEALLLLKLNAAFPLVIDGRINPERRNLSSVVQGCLPGPALHPPKKLAEEFLARFEMDNATIKKEYFPDLPRSTLFDMDMSDYANDHRQSLEEKDYLVLLEEFWRNKDAKPRSRTKTKAPVLEKKSRTPEFVKYPERLLRKWLRP